MSLIFMFKVFYLKIVVLPSSFLLLLLPSDFMNKKVYTPELFQHPSLNC